MKRPIRLHFWQTDPEFQCNIHACATSQAHHIGWIVDLAEPPAPGKLKTLLADHVEVYDTSKGTVLHLETSRYEYTVPVEQVSLVTVSIVPA